MNVDNDWCVRVAAFEGHADVVECLINNRANISVCNHEALYDSTLHGNATVVRVLVKHLLVRHGAVLHSAIENDDVNVQMLKKL